MKTKNVQVFRLPSSGRPNTSSSTVPSTILISLTVQRRPSILARTRDHTRSAFRGRTLRTRLVGIPLLTHIHSTVELQRLVFKSCRSGFAVYPGLENRLQFRASSQQIALLPNGGGAIEGAVCLYLVSLSA